MEACFSKTNHIHVAFQMLGRIKMTQKSQILLLKQCFFFSSFPEGKQRQQSVPVEAETHGPGGRNYRESSKKQTISSYQYGV